MNSDQIGGILRAILAAASGFAISKGLGDAGLWAAVTGGIVAIATAIWSYKTNTNIVKVTPVA